MAVENIELTLSHTDLGTLNEFSMMTLCGIAQAHLITSAKNCTLWDIKDREGRVLYPGFFMTHIHVPEPRGLERYRVWDKISVGVDVGTFGGMILDSRYILGKAGEIPAETSDWDTSRFPSMTGGTMFVVDGHAGEPVPAPPVGDLLGHLPRMVNPPPSVEKFSAAQAKGFLELKGEAKLRLKQPYLYPILEGRDLAPGRALMFATFSRLMDYAERALLTEHVWPAFPSDVVACLRLEDRETYFLGNVHAGDTVRVDVQATISPLQSVGGDVATPASLSLRFELYDETRKTLLLVSRAKKKLSISPAQKRLLRDADRLLSHHA